MTKEVVAISFLTLVICWLIYLYHLFDRKNFMRGVEHGSAEWGSKSDIKDFVDKTDDNNMILTNTESISINTRKTLRNNNIAVIGGSGSGKTRFF